MSAYWSKSREEHTGWHSRTAGFVRLAGYAAAAVSLGAGGFAQKYGGRAATWVGENLPRFGRKALSSLSSNGNMDLFLKESLFGETQSQWEAPTALHVAAKNAQVGQVRIKAFIGHIDPYIDKNASKAADKAYEALSSTLESIGKAQYPSDVNREVSTPHFIGSFIDQARKRGIHFNEQFHRDSTRIIDEALQRATEDSQAIAKSAAIKFSEGSQKDFLSVIKTATKRAQGSRKWLAKIFGSETREAITVAQLRTDEVKAQFNQYGKDIGLAPTRIDGKETELGDAILHRIDTSRSLVFGQPNRRTRAVVAGLAELDDLTHTGFYRDKVTGKLVSGAAVGKMGSNLVNAALDELQIPLFPGRFSLPLSSFKSFFKSSKLTHNVGSLANQPELRRGGIETQPFSQGLLVGDQLGIVTPSSDGLGVTFNSVQGKSFNAYSRHNMHYDRIADVRSLQVEAYQNTLTNFKGDEGSIGGIRKGLYRYGSHRTRFGIVDDEIVVDGANYVEGRLVGAMHGGHRPDVTQMHPTHLAAFLLGDGANELTLGSSPRGQFNLNRALTHISRQAGGKQVDLAPILHEGARDSQLDLRIRHQYPDSTSNLIPALSSAAHDPKQVSAEVHAALGGDYTRQTRARGDSGQSLGQALNMILEDPNTIQGYARGEGGMAYHARAELAGDTAHKPGFYKATEAIMSQHIGALGLTQLSDGIENTTIRQALLDAHSQLLTDKTVIPDNPVIEKLFSMLSINSPDAQRKLINNLIVGTEAKDGSVTYRVLEGKLQELGVAIADPAEYHALIDRVASEQNLGASYAREVKAKVFDIQNDAFENLGLLDFNYDPRLTSESKARGTDVYDRNQRMLARMNDIGIMGTLKERFNISRPFAPPDPGHVATNSSNFLLLETRMPDIWHHMGSSKGEMLDNLASTVKYGVQKGFGLPDYFRALVDPNYQHGPLSMVTQAMLQMPQRLAENWSLGLSGQDQITALRSSIGFYGKRVLPLMVGFEAYKNFNADMHDMNMPGIDDVGANLVANTNLNMARVKDALGITAAAKHLVSKFPGLDQYFSPRSEDEYRDYLQYGEEEVRNNRGWLIGTRSPIMGDTLKYVRPNFYRRWKSHWTEADNVDIADPSHSFLPSLLHPFNFISNIVDPNHWVEKHKYDRPYIQNDLPMSNPAYPGESYLTTNAFGAYGPHAIGSFGGGFPVQMQGGGMPMMIGAGGGAAGTYGPGHAVGGMGGPSAGGDLFMGGSGPGVGGAVGGIGGGGGGRLMLQGDNISLQLHKGVDERYLTGNNPVANWIDAGRRQVGLYGSLMNKLPFFPTPEIGLQQQSPGYATSFSRMMWAGEHGEASLGVGEFYRRFIQPDIEGYDAYSPYKNNMPSFMPQRYRTGDPYTRTPMGEMTLPGDAFEKLHPWVRPLKLRGSSIGLSEEEMIQKWLDPTAPLGDQSAEDIVDFGCVDTDTEILTETGWKRFGEFSIGDKILTLNHESGLTEWHPVEFIHSYYVNKKDLVSIETRWHSSLTTPNHKWPVIHLYQARKDSKGEFLPERREREWTTSNQLTLALNNIILAAEHADFPVQETYSTSLVEAVAWYWTEGSTQNNKICISQSSVKYPDKVQLIRDTLTNLIGSESKCMKIANPDKVPMWREYKPRADGQITFALNVHASKQILDLCPNKIVSTDFIKKLTKEQLLTFVEVSVKADGKSKNRLGQKDKDKLVALELACILLGKSINISYSEWIYRYKGKETVASEYTMGFPDRTLLTLRNKGEKIKRVQYSGIVWCPTVQNSTWCARRKGKVFYTGNSATHLQVQRQLNKAGVLMGAEVGIYDKENNISGTIDAIIRGSNGPEILEIKTQGSKKWGEVPDKYKDQLTFYMANTGITRGHLAFVNRDNPQQVRFETFDFDPKRWEGIVARANRARATMGKMIESGAVSPFESYDLLGRIEVLARTAPESAEFRKHVEYAEAGGGMGGFEKQRYEQALEIAKRLRNKHNLYNYRYTGTTETRKLNVLDISDDGTVMTEMGNVRLAGVKFDPQTFAYEEPDQLFARYGIKVGSKVPVTMMAGQFNPEVMGDTTVAAIIGNANTKMMHSKFASVDENDDSPLAYKARFGTTSTGELWEALAHSDNMFSNKFMRVRSPLEQFERGEVFGTDNARWNDVYHTMVKPTINSAISKNPIAAGVMGFTIPRLFFRTEGAKTKASAVGTILAAGLALHHKFVDQLTRKIWTPAAYRERAEFDEYWDMIEFVKQSSLAEAAKKKAKKLEGIDIDKLQDNEERTVAGMGPWSTLAVTASRRARQTMAGFNEMTGSLQDALAAVPSRHRQIAESLILHSSIKEKQRFYDLLPDTEKRVLGKFLGVPAHELPDGPDLTSFFEKHFLPDVDWGGWSPLVDTEDLKTRSAELENMHIDQPNRARVAKARAYTHNIMIPKMDHKTSGSIRFHIHQLMSKGGMDGVDVNFAIRPSNKTVVNIDMNLFQDQTNEMLAEQRRGMQE